MIPIPLQSLIKNMAKMPGLGPRSAQRAALYLLKNKEKMADLMQLLDTVKDELQTCQICGNIALESACEICQNLQNKRDKSTLCIVEDIDDIWAMERSGFKGVYHVLGGVISALDGIGPEKLTINQLLKRISENEIKEVILALNAGVDGQTTSHLVAQRIENKEIKVTTLAMGIPVGGSVDYLDDGTLMLALNNRKSI